MPKDPQATKPKKPPRGKEKTTIEISDDECLSISTSYSPSPSPSSSSSYLPRKDTGIEEVDKLSLTLKENKRKRNYLQSSLERTPKRNIAKMRYKLAGIPFAILSPK
jgi:hypothetical protein